MKKERGETLIWMAMCLLWVIIAELIPDLHWMTYPSWIFYCIFGVFYIIESFMGGKT